MNSFIEVTMPFYQHPANEGPYTVRLNRWSIREFPDGTRHFVGYSPETRDGRFSSAIVELDVASRTGRTETGRVYVLEGPNGSDSNAEYVFHRVATILGCADSWRDVTAELIPDCRTVKHRPKDEK